VTVSGRGALDGKERSVGFLDKLKEGAGQAKELAQQAAEKAKDEAKELQLKRQMTGEFETLGQAAFDLVQRGEVSHAELEPSVQRIVELKAALAELEPSDEPSDSDDGASAPPQA
jgi:hypothetical protein